MSGHRILEVLARERMIAIVRRNDASARDLAVMAGHLADAGAHVIEFPLTGGTAVDAIRSASASCPDSIIGAGTVLTTDDVDRVADAGARFVVAPGLDDAVVAHARDLGLATFPGAMTATEIERAVGLNATAVKVFPAGPLGTAYISAMLAPYPTARLIPTGGVTVDGAAAYLRAGALAVGLGSDLLGDGSARQISENVARFRRGVAETDAGRVGPGHQ